jgi:hypothetical protein
VRVDHGSHGVGGIVKSVDELEAQGKPKRQQKKDTAAHRDRLSKEFQGNPLQGMND